MRADKGRAMFSAAMSAMYRSEVPQYGALLDLVRDINRDVLRRHEADAYALDTAVERERLDQERHGAIRLGTAAELRLMRRLFAVLGMVPVGYYDLSVAGVPVHSTAFRATDPGSLRRSPFRLFTSLLRLDLIADRDLRETATGLLNQRRIVTPEALALIERFETDGVLDDARTEAFVAAALDSFRWHAEATVDRATYQALRAAHPLVADIVCFKGPHINHLTPRVLDIDAAQAAMAQRGLAPKAVIEGPPARACAILLRQTSFKALSEPVRFGDVEGRHVARFGEIEQRGVALTPAGRACYDALLAQADPNAFAAFPDDHEVLRQERLAYYRYSAMADVPLGAQSLEEAIVAGSVRAEPILYEDFLPVSAAGIFRSNLADAQSALPAPSSRQADFEDALGCAVLDPFALYAAQSDASAASIAL
ncbi:2-oxoadipate dioxygenase/decarboxylase HglS [Lichenicoccus sp.]|uniref:2-oxoadipate dioxygenase/decarboxylase HglS n=1 Tax=Lichenicoccus sp. TaxID=2781899 RepID=UPI003D0E9D5D